MKVLLVNGSPKANGNTARALAEIAEQLDAEGIDTEVFQLGAKPIRDCIGCGQCGKLGGRCTFDDDVVNELIAAAAAAGQQGQAQGACHGKRQSAIHVHCKTLL